MLTSKGLVDHAKMALNEKWGYVFGTFGNVLTVDMFKDRLASYPDNVGKFKEFIVNNYIGKRTSDCAGLIKSYLWWNGKDAVYNPKFDLSANQMYAIAIEKGPLNSIPEIPGLCLWKEGHAGIYIGGGQAIEAHGTKEGVIQTPIKGPGATPWTHWFKSTFITYETAPLWEQAIDVGSNGYASEWKKAIKTLSESAGTNVTVDPIFKYLPELLTNIFNKKR